MTEIWCANVSDADDLRAILARDLQLLHNSEYDTIRIVQKIHEFVVWFMNNYSHMRRFVCVIIIYLLLLLQLRCYYT
jgi:hypothetical protein